MKDNKLFRRSVWLLCVVCFILMFTSFTYGEIDEKAPQSDLISQAADSSSLVQNAPGTSPVPQCINPSYEVLENLANHYGKTPGGELAGVVVISRTNGAQRNSSLGEVCPNLYSWRPSDNVLIIEYKQDVQLWHVAPTTEGLKKSTWFMKENPMGIYTKSETVNLLALPNCVGRDISDPYFGYPVPMPTPSNNCQPNSCSKYSTSKVIKWVGVSIIPKGTQIAFGCIGPNMWGQGGELQWHIINSPPQSPVVQKAAYLWPGE